MLCILDETNPHSEILLLNVEKDSYEEDLVKFDTSKKFEELSPKDIKTLEKIGEFMKIVNYPDDMDYDEAVKYVKAGIEKNIQKGFDIRKTPSAVIDISYDEEDKETYAADFHFDEKSGSDKERVSKERIEQFRQNVSNLSPDILKRIDVMLDSVNKMIPGFQRIRRITGYLVGTLDRFNDGKRAEVKDRVKHGIVENMTSDYGRGIDEETYETTQSENEDFVIDANGILFEYTGNAESINIPDNVKMIADSAFKDNKTVIHVSIPEGVEKIGERAFSGCSYLKTVNLPSSLVSIGERAFDSCGQLNYINSPKNLTEIGVGAFSNCQSIEYFVIPQNVKVISPSAFEQCHALTNIDLPQGLEGIAKDAFKGCVSLDSIELPDTLKRIGDNAFSKCVSLIKADIPKGTKYSIGEKASFPKTCKVNDKSAGLEK